jgi:hypothetical protein
MKKRRMEVGREIKGATCMPGMFIYSLLHRKLHFFDRSERAAESMRLYYVAVTVDIVRPNAASVSFLL